MLPRIALLTLSLIAPMTLASPGHAQDAVPVETAELDGSLVTLHLQPFLTEEELATLRVIMTSKEAKAMFLPGEKGFAAIAVSPEEGFIRDGVPPASATALADFPDADTARVETAKICDAAKKAKTACVVVLEIAPK